MLHASQQRRAARVVASAATDVDDCRMLLSILGLGPEVVVAARCELATRPRLKSASKRHAA